MSVLRVKTCRVTFRLEQIMSRWQIDRPTELALGELAEVEVELVKGALTVVGEDGPARLEVHTVHRGPLLVEHEGAKLTIRYDRPVRQLPGPFVRLPLLRRDRAMLTLRVPPTCPVRVATVNTAVTVAALTAPVTVQNICGDITLTGLTGGARVSTGRGLVRAVRVGGDLRVDIHAGDLTVLEGRPGTVRAHSIHGSHTVDLGPQDRPYDVDLSCRVGDVTVRLPSDADVDVELATVRGKIASEFAEVCTARPGSELARRARARSGAAGVLGSGTGRLRALAERGRVTLLRAAPVPAE